MLASGLSHQVLIALVSQLGHRGSLPLPQLTSETWLVTTHAL